MESQKPKIAMYVKRNFGEKLSASFDFIKENWEADAEIYYVSAFTDLSYSSAEFERDYGVYYGAG